MLILSIFVTGGQTSSFAIHKKIYLIFRVSAQTEAILAQERYLPYLKKKSNLMLGAFYTYLKIVLGQKILIWVEK